MPGEFWVTATLSQQVNMSREAEYETMGD